MLGRSSGLLLERPAFVFGGLMSFFGQRSLPSKKKEKNRYVKKSVKKTTSAISVSSSVLQLAKQFSEFVLFLHIDDKQRRRKPQYYKWAEQLQQFIDTSCYGYVQVQAVFDWYVQHYKDLWRIEAPNSFIKHFESLLNRYERTINPYTQEQLKTLMLWLSRLQWKCGLDELELVVGRSLWMVSQVLDKCHSHNSTLKQYSMYWNVLDKNIGNSFDFVQFYFDKWYWEHSNTEYIWNAEITKKRMIQMVRVWLNEYGMDETTIETFIPVLDCLDIITFCSDGCR
jgi:hypothetical protein